MLHNHTPSLTALRAMLAGHAVMLAAIRLQLLLRKANFNPAQLRIPSGQPGGGQWTSEGGAESAPEDASVIPVARKPGGLPQALWNLTVRQFVSRYCQASINRELPGQFENVTIGDLLNLARGGDRSARTCVKLLERGKYRK